MFGVDPPDDEDERSAAYASVREMAAKFEHLMQLQLQQPPVTPPTPAARYSGRKSAASSPLRSPVSPSAVFYTPTPAARTGQRPEVLHNLHDDDLLFDNLITDITEYITVQSRESTASVIGDETTDVAAADNADNGESQTTPDSDSAIYQNIAAALADKQRIESSASVRNGQRVMQEMLDNERAYIAALTAGIDQYIMAPQADDRPEQPLLDQIFGNIIVIRNFHENTFLPALANSGTDAERLCGCFRKYIEAGYFYSYIEYAINRQRAVALVEQHQPYFRRRQAEIQDALGLENLLIQPIQRLPKYQLLLYQMIQHLGTRLSREDDNAEVPATGTADRTSPTASNSNSDVKMQIAACCRAEKHIQRLLDRLNASMTIADIVDFHANLEFLLLNIGENGEFQIVQEFDIHDLEHKRRYRGKLFLFDKCVVFTEALDRQRLRFRGFYQQRHVGIAFAEGRNVFYLYHRRRGNQEIECAAEAADTIQVWSEALGRMMLSSAGLVSWTLAVGAGSGVVRRGTAAAAQRNPKLSLG